MLVSTALLTPHWHIRDSDDGIARIQWKKKGPAARFVTGSRSFLRVPVDARPLINGGKE
jgi:hypothetical protein